MKLLFAVLLILVTIKSFAANERVSTISGGSFSVDCSARASATGR